MTEAVAGPSSFATATTSCSHCGLPVPKGLERVNAEHQFCCDGCRTVYAIIHEQGLDRYYSYRDEADARPARTTGRSYAEFDDPKFHELYVTSREATDGSRASVELLLEGVHCAACVWLVEKLPRILPGVVRSTLNFGRATLRVEWDPSAVALSEIARRLDALGYPSHPQRGVDARRVRSAEDRALLSRMAVAGAAAGNVMLMAAALYSGHFAGMAASHEALFRWGSLLVSVPAIAYSGSLFFKGALGALRARTPHMDLPISLGIAAGFGWGAVNVVRGAGEVYFDSVTALIFLLLVGRWVQRRQQRSAADAAELLHSLAPSTARLLDANDVVREVPVEAVPRDALVEVRAGEHVPADGVVVSGDSAVDVSLLTGESRPERVAVGARVHAGSVNVASRLVVRVSETGEATRVGQLMREVEAAARRKAPVIALADRLSGWFVAAVVALAVVTFAGWARVDAGIAVEHTVALLVVACPCALGLATPLAVSAAIGRAASNGILIKGGAALESAARPALIVFDKTGTLTEGRIALARWHGDGAAQSLVAAVEARSAHPIARALADALPASDAPVDDFEQIPGAGLAATVAGRAVVVGSRSFVGARVRDADAELTAISNDAAERGNTPVWVAVDGALVAVAELGDPIRPEARDCLLELRERGHRLAMLSGDDPVVVAAVAERLDVPFELVRGGASPEDKLAFVEARAATERVFMVGDGVNDAAALSAASVGVAVHGGAEASLSAADVFATRDGLAPVVALACGAGRTLDAVKLNLAFSLLYNGIGASLAVTGLIGPLVAAVLMPLSSLTVVTISYRYRTFGAS